MNAPINDVASTAQLKQQSVTIGIMEFMLGCMEFSVGANEADEPTQQNGAQAMHDSLEDFVASMLGNNKINPARVNEQQRRISALVIRLGVTGVYRKVFVIIRNAGTRVWNNAFGRRAECALLE